MSESIPSSGDPHAHPTGDNAWFGRRKRIASREVSPVEIEGAITAEMQSAAHGSLKPADVIDIPGLPAGPPPEVILDPTLFSTRRRHPGQNLAYRLTQLVALAAPMCALGAIGFSFMQHRLRAMMLAGVACLLSAVAVRLVRKSQLARRLRGYVAAACILALIAMVISMMPNLFRDDGKPAPPAVRTSGAERP